MKLLIRLWVWLFYRKGWRIGPFIRGVRHSHGLPWRPKKTTTGWTFDGGEPHYITRDCSGVSGSVKVRYRAWGNFTAVGNRNPAGVTPHFQRAGDNWSAQGKYETYRWYSVDVFPLTPGEHEIDLPLTGDKWKGVTASTGVSNPAAFAEAKRDAVRVGLCFGAAGGRGHGVTGGGFELLSFEVG